MKVFVHGNPECDAIWGPLIDELAKRGVSDVTALSPPGFGAPVPAGFEATPAGYAAWLAGELEAIDGPIDLLGHDWGAGHVFGLAATRPDLIRSWAADCAALLHPEYEWHAMAQVWQTPEAGEAAIQGMLGGSLEARQAMLEGLGISGDIARRMAEAATPEMGECILTLYRAAAQPALREIADRLAAAERRPSLLVVASEDEYVPAALAGDVAKRFGSETVALEGQGHWWMLSDPATAADALAAFWSRLPGDAGQGDAG